MRAIFASLLITILAAKVGAQISISSTSPVTENYDGIGSSATASLPSNWKMSAAGTVADWTTGTNVTATTAAASSGSPTTGGIYNWATSAGTDRAIGFMTSGSYSSPNTILAYYRNNSGQIIDDITIAFDIERYRINTSTFSLAFFTSTDGSTWTSRSAGDISTSVFATGSSAYTFASPQVESKNFTITDFNIPLNGDFYLRWVFTNTGSTNSQGLGLDNVSVTATLISAPSASNLDYFTRSDNNTVGGGWTETETNSDVLRISSNRLLAGYQGTGASTGREFLWQDVSSLYETTFGNSINQYVWLFNVRQSRSNPSGFDSGDYGTAFVLGTTTSDITTGSGYAVTVGNTGTPDYINLVRFSNGLDLNSNIISTLVQYQPSSITNYFSIMVTYDPVFNSWKLYVRDDGSSSFSDPTTIVTDASNLRGTATDYTLESSNLKYLGCYWNRNSSTSDNAVFDNVWRPVSTTASNTYTWNATSGTADWATASNWTPSRTAPSNNDVLYFSNGGTAIATGIPTQTVGKVIVTNNTTIGLRSTSSQTLTIQGGSGTDLDVSSGSAFNIDSDQNFTVSLGSGATGSISGTVKVRNGVSGTSKDHRLTATDAGALTFNSGSVFEAEDLNGNVFGSGGTNGTVIFASGSVYISGDGANPFGTGSKVTFQSGSLYKHSQNANAPSLAGRTYANFEYSFNGTLNHGLGGSACTMENLTVSQGTFNISLSANNTALNITLNGDLAVSSGATFSYSPANSAAASTFTFSGSYSHVISGSGSIIFGTNATVDITSDITLTGAFPLVNGTLNRKSGTLAATGGGAFSYGASATLNYTGTTTLTASSEWPNTGSSSSGPAIINIDNGQTISASGKEVKGILYVKTGSTLSTSGNLTLQSGASLLHGSGTPNGGGTVSGNVIVKRTGHSGYAYNFWSSPVSNASVSILGSNLYYYEPANALDLTQSGLKAGWTSASGIMTAGKGYISTHGGTVSFSGPAGNAPTGTPITVSITKNVGASNNVPWNLIGNPFPSSIDADAFIDVNGPLGSGAIAGALYFWDDDNSGGSGWNSNDYAVWTKAGAVPGSPAASANGNSPNGHIASGQAFFVNKTNDGTATIEFRNTMRSSTNNVFFRQKPIGRFWVNVTNPDNEINETLIAFLDDATDSVDLLYDAQKIKGNPVISLYSKIGMGDYAIQALPELTDEKVIALGLDVVTSGAHILRLSYKENLDETVTIILEDRQRNYFQNLNVNPDYEFYSAAGMDIARFYLHVNPPLQIGTTEESCDGIDGVIELFQPGSKSWYYKLFDRNNRLVESGSGFNGPITFTRLTSGDYRLELTDRYGYRVTKKIIIDGKAMVHAAFIPTYSIAPAGQLIRFVNNSTGAASYQWDFGDGTILSDVSEPEHAYEDAGKYTVTLKAFNTDCEDELSLEISVYKIASGINPVEDAGVYVSTLGEFIIIRFENKSGSGAEIEIKNLLGQRVSQQLVTSSGEIRITLPEAVAGQYYFLTVKTSGKELVYKVLLPSR